MCHVHIPLPYNFILCRVCVLCLFCAHYLHHSSLLDVSTTVFLLLFIDDSIASFHYGNWRAKGHVMWILTYQQAAW